MFPLHPSDALLLAHTRADEAGARDRHASPRVARFDERAARSWEPRVAFSAGWLRPRSGRDAPGHAR